MRRELRAVRDEAVYGAVDTNRDPVYEGIAGEVLGVLRRQLGDARAIESVMADGWSNGYLYFAEATP